MGKVIISLAPVQAGVAIDFEEVVKDIVESIRTGASMCHLHSRLPDGSLSKDISLMEALFEAALHQVDFIVQASTGGISDMTIQERALTLNYSKVESASLNGGSTNLGHAIYKNSLSDIEYCYKQCQLKNIVPEVEVFNIAMLQTMEHLKKEDDDRPFLYNLVFGHEGGMESTIESLIAFRSFLPPQSSWGVTHYDRENWTFLAAAIAMGASLIRIGFEDSRYLDTQKQADTNTQLVTQLRNLIEAMGLEVATPDEGRKIIGGISC
jgi:3-keto-5-aminohexanoate cleavage enzyme